MADFWCHMTQGMDGKPDEMESRWLTLVVEPLEFVGKLGEGFVSIAKLFRSDGPLVEDSDSVDKLTEVDPVLVG